MSYYANNTPNVRHISWCFRSQFILSGPEKLNRNRNVRKLNSVAKNSILCPNVRNSVVYQHGPISNPQLHGRIPTSQHYDRTSTSQHPGRNSTESFFKIFQILSPSLLGMTSSPLQPHFCLGFIMTMVIVISFVHERKLHQLTIHLNSKPE